MTIKTFLFYVVTFLTVSPSIAQQSDKIDCAKYWKRQDSLGRIKLDYFKNQIIESAKKDQSIPRPNIEFLKELYHHLSLTYIERESMPTLEKPIFPIFKLEEDKQGIFAFPKYNCYKNEQGYTACDNISAEKQAIQSNPTIKSEPDYNPQLKPNTKAFEKIVTNRELRVYTSSGSYLDEVTQLSIYADDCLEYYHYQLRNQAAKKPLFASKHDLKLVFKSNPEIDRQIERQYAKGCYDCTFEYEPVKSFATLKGIDQVFFTYTDTFPLNNRLNYPERTISMLLNNGTVVTLWSESIDLFGCSCL